MSEILRRIKLLPRTAKNPFKQLSTVEKASRVLASLNRLPNFNQSDDELATIVHAIKSEDNAYTLQEDLGHSTKDLEMTLNIIESRVRAGVLSEEIANKYLIELRIQKNINLQRPPTLAQRLRSYSYPVAEGAAYGILASIPLGILMPYDSIENYLYRVGAGTVLATTGLALFRSFYKKT